MLIRMKSKDTVTHKGVILNVVESYKRLRKNPKNLSKNIKKNLTYQKINMIDGL